ncbi:hypothetical protein CC85DRAFT_306521 [Cutaneotrichosporon oleaginosum]|uniref:Dynamitin-domain-containing protein n=1 Tax=Cutaneotrichosporon oleaginosum TaxID=879819 RepID=A0A0J0XX78_9TREE|nr:uncharacterized protein CC85DRAFT_306521 [Cutaneotrichosporon oleaginosum]KLT45655.1 hypothetical protein CC85DRAFT_306521 [Cutaneotrichosporon oleaginosum]TXT04553.1 hypothetical protein COLE_07372 [Cutaneotrichosporon oleaginosum]
MSGKYSGLPDIDSAPDIYETVDEPVVGAHRDDDEDPKKIVSRSEDIDVGDLPSRRRALKVFTEPSDHSDPPRETQLSRLRRLQAEVAQLERELQTSPAPVTIRSDSAKRKSVLPPRQAVDVVSELSALRERLNAASEGATISERKDFAGRLARLEAAPERKEGVSSPSPVNLRVGDVDKRLAVLERAVGVADTEADSSQVSLSDTLARLDHFMNLLTQPRHLDSVARRVKLLLADLDRAAASRRPGAPASAPGAATLSPSDLERLQSIFSLLPRLDPLLPIIPPLLTRLRSLSTLHAESIAIADDLRELQSSDRAMAEEERELRAVVAGVQQGMVDASVSISKNWESVQARLTALDDKLTRLNL